MSTDPGSDPNSTRSYRNLGNRGGIIFVSNHENGMKNLSFIHLTVRNCTYNGVYINGVDGLYIDHCDITENGSSEVPGPKLQHNLLISHSNKINVKSCRLDTSPFGSGIALDHCNKVTVQDCEIARNAYYGVLMTDCYKIDLAENLIEANDRSGVMVEFLYLGSAKINIEKNLIQFNNGYGVEAYAAKNLKSVNKICTSNCWILIPSVLLVLFKDVLLQQ